MAATIISVNSKTIKLEIEVSLSNSMLTTEENIQIALNEGGVLVTKEVLSNFDTDGSPIKVGNDKYTSKGTVPKNYQSPYGEFCLERHVYQNSQGGKVFCPLENSARIIVGSTPKFAKQVSSKYSELGAARVQKDLEENHGRHISREFIRCLSESVSNIIIDKEQSWHYCPPIDVEHVKSIGIGLDGTCMHLSEDGWRETMVGTIALYDKDGERLHTMYSASPPEYGKKEFHKRFEEEILKIKELYPLATYTGVADGAQDNWSFLERYTETQTIDFYHASEYLSNAADVLFRKKEKREFWFISACHKLKHEQGGAVELLKEMEANSKKKYSEKKMEKLQKSITYFKNHLHQMDYSDYLKRKLPIGSGVTEAACKVIVKQRLCSSGMRWKDEGARSVLCLRSVNYSGDKWKQMWNRISKSGF